MPTLPFFSFGNVAILGDAAHVRTPFMGAGAGQAIEVSLSMILWVLSKLMIQDASTLAALLSNELSTKTTVSQVLEIYSRIRQPIATEVARRAHLNGEHFSLRTLTESEDHDLSAARSQGIVKQIQDNFEFCETEPSVDLQQAMALLGAELRK